MLSSAKIGRSCWRYYQATVARGGCEYYTEHGDTPGRWYGSGLAALGLVTGAVVAEAELEAVFARAISPTTGQLAVRLRQDQERTQWGPAWTDTGLVFTREDGSAYHPERITKAFRRLTLAAGLRPVRLHDLRHGQASLMLAAGVARTATTWQPLTRVTTL